MLGASALLLRVTLAAPAVAERPYHLTYQAPPECPDRSQFAERVQAYASSATLVGDPGVLGISIEVESEGKGFRGTVRAEPPGQPPSVRVLPATTCDDLVQAAALLVAILVDPEAGRPAAPGPLPAPAAPSAPPLEQPLAAAPVGSGPSAPPAAASARAADWVVGAGVMGEVSGAVAPVTAFGPGLELHLESTSEDALSPWLALGAHALVSPLVVEPEGSARFQVVSGRVAACPARARFRGVEMWMGPCGSFEMGQLTVSPEAVGDPRPARIFWAAAALSGRVELGLGALRLAVEAGATFPLISDTFHFDPGQRVVHRVPDTAFQGALGLGVSFW